MTDVTMCVKVSRFTASPGSASVSAGEIDPVGSTTAPSPIAFSTRRLLALA